MGQNTNEIQKLKPEYHLKRKCNFEITIARQVKWGGNIIFNLDVKQTSKQTPASGVISNEA